MDLMTLLALKAMGSGSGSESGGSNISIDKTLTKSGYAADAKVVGTKLAQKADQDTITEQLALKADVSDMTDQLALKVDTTAMNEQLELKADVSDVTASLALKANISDVTSMVGEKQDKIVRIETQETAVQIEPNTKVYITGSPESVSFTLGEAEEGCESEYILAFRCGDTAAELGLPSGVTLRGDSPTANKYYELLINEDKIAYGIAT